MSRPLRIELAGGRHEDIYADDADRKQGLAILAAACARFNWRCHAYCLMSNHYPLVVETVEGSLAQGMRQLSGVCSQCSNRGHDRVGHVFLGRYKAKSVVLESSLLIF